MTKLAVFFIVATFVAWWWQIEFPGAALLGLGALLAVPYLIFMFTQNRTWKRGSS